LAALNFASGGNALLPDPGPADVDATDRRTFLGLLHSLGEKIIELIPGKAHKKRPRPTPQALDFRKILADKQAATEAAERSMLQNRLGQEMASRRILVSAMLNADEGRQRHLMMQIKAIEAKIADLEQHLLKLKSGLRQ
jgi:hypothetical protein